MSEHILSDERIAEYEHKFPDVTVYETGRVLDSHKAIAAKLKEAIERLDRVRACVLKANAEQYDRPCDFTTEIDAALADAPAAQPSEAERLRKALSAIDELMPVAGMLPECDLSDDALVYQGSATSENWRCHVPMGVVAIWPQLPEQIRLLVFLCCFPVSQHRCEGIAEAATYAAGLTRLRGVLGEIREQTSAVPGGHGVDSALIAIEAILAREGI